MERAEKIGFGIAGAAHVLLFAALSSRWLGVPEPIKLNTPPIEISIADEVALESTAPKLATQPPPPTPGEVEGPPEQAAPAPSEAVVEPEPAPPVPKPTPAPTPAPKPKPKPAPKKVETPRSQPQKATPAKKPETRTKATDSGKQAQSSGSKLKLDTSDWMKSTSRSDSADAKPVDGAMASSLGPAQKSALDAEIRRQLKPHWKAPTGADAESLRTIVTVRLAKDGSLVGTPEIVETQGITASNRTQVRLHQEQAIKAIRLAAPFKLPPAFYSSWNFLRLSFDKRLSQ